MFIETPVTASRNNNNSESSLIFNLICSDFSSTEFCEGLSVLKEV